jgi:chromosome segregation ATPase
MTAPRRRIVRPVGNGQTNTQQRQRQLQRLQERLEHERIALARWQKRLRRAFNTFEKLHATITRLERQIARLVNPS